MPAQQHAYTPTQTYRCSACAQLSDIYHKTYIGAVLVPSLTASITKGTLSQNHLTRLFNYKVTSRACSITKGTCRKITSRACSITKGTLSHNHLTRLFKRAWSWKPSCQAHHSCLINKPARFPIFKRLGPWLNEPKLVNNTSQKSVSISSPPGA
jgi:hypothetical protein